MRKPTVNEHLEMYKKAMAYFLKGGEHRVFAFILPTWSMARDRLERAYGWSRDSGTPAVASLATGVMRWAKPIHGSLYFMTIEQAGNGGLAGFGGPAHVFKECQDHNRCSEISALVRANNGKYEL